MAVAMRVLAAALVALAFTTQLASAQSELLSITSFVACVEVDLSAMNHQTGVGQNGSFLDCTPTMDSDSTGDTVTILDMRIVAGTWDGDSSLQIDLTTVTAQNTPPTTSPSGTECNINTDSDGLALPTDCALTTQPYSMEITASEYIYYYDLTLDESFEFPYCHVMHYYDTSSESCDKIKYAGGSNEYNQYTQTCSARVELLPSCYNSGTGTNTGSPQCETWMSLLSSTNIEGIMTGRYNNGTEFNISQYYSAFDADSTGCDVTSTQRCIRTEFSSDVLRKPSPVMYPEETENYIKWDDRLSVLLGEIFPAAAYTLHDEFPLPTPLPYGLDESNTFADSNGDLQILNCVGPCRAGTQKCYNTYDGNQPEAIRSDGTILEVEGFDVGMFALGPSCSVYNVAVTPRVAVSITVALTNLDTNETTYISTNNVNPGARTTDEFHTFALEIVGVGSLNNVLGPPMGGAIILCGGPIEDMLTAGGMSYAAAVEPSLLNEATQPPSMANKQPFLSMRTAAAPYDELENPLYNPWQDVIASLNPLELPRAFYPSNRFAGYQYMCQNDTNSDGRNDDADPADTRTCVNENYMWYWVGPQNRNTLGRGCAQMGITDMFWNSGGIQGQTLANQFGAQTCNSDPFVCFPGFSTELGFDAPFDNSTDMQFTFGYSPVTGCMASQAFEIARFTGTPPVTYASRDELENEALLWRKFPVRDDPNDLNFTEYVAQVPSRYYSLGTLTNILHNFMPFGYDSKQPNAWLQIDANTPRLYMEPSQTVSNPTMAAFTPAISVEFVVYLVGKFVAFEVVVPSGIINQEACTTNDEHADVSSQLVSVTNTGTTAAQYHLTVTCPFSSGLLPVTPDVWFPPNNTELLEPWNTSAAQIISYAPDPDFDPPPGQVVEPCVLELLPASGDVFSSLDQQDVFCNHTFIDVNGSQPAPVPFFGPNNPAWDKVDCGGCFNFPCYKLFHGGTLHSPCALVITIGFLAGAAFAVTALVMTVVYKIVYYDHLTVGQDKVKSVLNDSQNEYEGRSPEV